MPIKQARIQPGNIESGTNGVGKPLFGLKLCAVRAVPLRMRPACLECQKTRKSENKNRFSAIFGPHGALFAPYYLVWCGALRGGAKR